MADLHNPYAPPKHDASPVAVGAPETYKSTEKLTRSLLLGLAITSLFGVIQVGSDWLQIELLTHVADGGTITEAEANSNDTRVGLVAIAFALSLLTSGILWCVWQNRTHKNAQALGGAEYTEFGPNAWGWFFCPVLNLWKPLQAMRELWRIADHESTQMNEPKLFNLWWGAWIIASIAMRAGGKLSEDTQDLDLLITCTWLDLVASGLYAAAGFAAILIIREISKRGQKALLRHQAG